MRLPRRQTNQTHLPMIAALTLLLIATACSSMEVTIDRKVKRESDRRASFLSTPQTLSETDQIKPGSKYLATVHIRYSDSKGVKPLEFDIRKEKGMFMAVAPLVQTQETDTFVHLGANKSGEVAVGARFSWRF